MGIFGNYHTVSLGNCIVCGQEVTTEEEEKTKQRITVNQTGKELSDGSCLCNSCAKKYSFDTKDLKKIDRDTFIQKIVENGAVSPWDFHSDKDIAYGAGAYASLQADNSRKLLKFVYMNIGFFSKNKYREKIRRMEDLVDFQLLEDGGSVADGNSLLGAAIGGATFGAAGAIVGSGARSKNVKATCQTLSIRVVFNDLDDPDEHIYLIGSEASALFPAGTKHDSSYYKQAMSIAEKCLSYLTVLLKQNEESKHTVAASQTRPSAPSAEHVADESNSRDEIIDAIKKLSDLCKAGILTEEEFASKKSELLKKI